MTLPPVKLGACYRTVWPSGDPGVTVRVVGLRWIGRKTGRWSIEYVRVGKRADSSYISSAYYGDFKWVRVEHDQQQEGW